MMRRRVMARPIGRMWARRLRGMRAMGWVVVLRSEGGEGGVGDMFVRLFVCLSFWLEDMVREGGG